MKVAASTARSRKMTRTLRRRRIAEDNSEMDDARLERPDRLDRLTIAIDGPSGAGKGTVARAIAARLGYRHIDSGAMYRAVAWKAIRDSVLLDNESAVAALAEHSSIGISSATVSVDGVDVTRDIRTPAID